MKVEGLSKPCSMCGEVKPYSEYYATKTWFYSYCKSCAAIKRKVYNSRTEVKQMIKARNAERYTKPGGLERAREYNKKYESRPDVKAKISERKRKKYLERIAKQKKT